jgi:hypothetical protein
MDSERQLRRGDAATIAELFARCTGTGDVSSRGFTPEEALVGCGPQPLPAPGATAPQECGSRDVLCLHPNPVTPSPQHTDRTTDSASSRSMQTARRHCQRTLIVMAP